MKVPTVRPIVAWFDLWVGIYWNAATQRLYVMPIPCVGFVPDWGPT